MNIDGALTQWVNSFSSRLGFLDGIMIAITQMGPYLLVGLLCLRWFGKTKRENVRHLVIQCGLATALSLVLNQSVLLLFRRTRPYEMGLTRLLIEKSQDPSFPSDHATVVFAVTALLVLRRDKWAAPSFVFAILVCVSRVFVGTHFISDVVGGAATGVVGAFVVVRFYQYVERITARFVRLL